jgi:hypothetical protein
MGYPARMDVLYAHTTGGLMTSSAVEFNTGTGQQDDTIHQAIIDFSVQEKNAGSLQPMTCNQWNDKTEDVLLEANNELMGGSFGLYAFRRSTQTIVNLLAADSWNSTVGNANIVTCTAGKVLMLDTTGAWEYNTLTKTKTKVGTGFVDFQHFFGSDRAQAYYAASNNRLGMYDTTTKVHTYVTFRVPTGTTVDTLRFYNENSQGIWFTSMPNGNPSTPVNKVYMFNPQTGSWTTYDLKKKLVADEQIITVQKIGDEIWAMTNINPYILRPNETEFVLADKDFLTQMMGNDVRSLYPTPNGIWFANGFGVWGQIY